MYDTISKNKRIIKVPILLMFTSVREYSQWQYRYNHRCINGF